MPNPPLERTHSIWLLQAHISFWALRVQIARAAETLGLTGNLTMPDWPIPPDFPLDDLIGQEVTQICVGLGDVQVPLYKQPQAGTPDKWKPGARINVESAFSLEESGSVPYRVEQRDFRQGGGKLTGLLGKAVTDVQREAGNELRLLFSGGFVLVLHTKQEGFESYHLKIGGQSVTVTGV